MKSIFGGGGGNEGLETISQKGDVTTSQKESSSESQVRSHTSTFVETISVENMKLSIFSYSIVAIAYVAYAFTTEGILQKVHPSSPVRGR